MASLTLPAGSVRMAQKLSDRSYLVAMSGQVLCRNRQAIEPSQSEHVTEQNRPKAESAVPQTPSMSTSTVPAVSTTISAARSSSRTTKKRVSWKTKIEDRGSVDRGSIEKKQ